MVNCLEAQLVSEGNVDVDIHSLIINVNQMTFCKEWQKSGSSALLVCVNKVSEVEIKRNDKSLWSTSS
jgi:hypothetical protein